MAKRISDHFTKIVNMKSNSMGNEREKKKIEIGENTNIEYELLVRTK